MKNGDLFMKEIQCDIDRGSEYLKSRPVYTGFSDMLPRKTTDRLDCMSSNSVVYYYYYYYRGGPP